MEDPRIHWETPEMWRKYVERQLYELGTLVKGQIPVQADRVADLVEQIDAVRKDLNSLTERHEKMAAWLRTHLPPKNGATT